MNKEQNENVEPNFLVNIVATHKNISKKKTRKFISSKGVLVDGKQILDPLFWVSSGSKIAFENVEIVIYQ